MAPRPGDVRIARTGRSASTVAPRRSRSPKGEGERLRDEILRATEKLLLKAGDVGAVSIRAIADAVGVTPPSIYLHFPDKDALMFAVCQLQFTRLEEAIGAAVATIDDPVERMRAMGRTYVRFGVEHPEEYRILLMSKGEFSQEDFDSGDVPGVSAFQALMDGVERCMAAGAFAKDDPFKVATMLWAVMHGVTSLRIAIPTFPWISETALLDHVLEVQVRGLAP